MIQGRVELQTWRGNKNLCPLQTLEHGTIKSKNKYIEKNEYNKTHFYEGEQFRYPDNMYLLKANNSKTTKKCKIFSKLTIKTPERCH